MLSKSSAVNVIPQEIVVRLKYQNTDILKLGLYIQYIKVWDWIWSNHNRPVMWNMLVYVWSCCLSALLVYMEYGTMHCWHRWPQRKCLVSRSQSCILSYICVNVCLWVWGFVNILFMSRSVRGMPTAIILVQEL